MGSAPGPLRTRHTCGIRQRYGPVLMTIRGSHVHVAALLAISSALLGVGCSGGGGGTGASSDITDAAAADDVGTDEMTLDGVRFDVRRDPG